MSETMAPRMDSAGDSREPGPREPGPRKDAEVPTWRALAPLLVAVTALDWAISWVADRMIHAPRNPWVMGPILEYAARLAVVVALVLRFRGKRGALEQLGISRKTLRADARWALGVVVAGAGVTALIAGVALFFLRWRGMHLPMPSPRQVEWMRTAEAWRSLARTGAATVICAPIVEEIVYRGVLLRLLHVRLRHWKAVAASAVVFALLHALPYGRGPFVPLELVGGVVLGLVFLARRSILPGVLLHAAGNAAFLLFPFVHVWLHEHVPSLFRG